MKRSKIVPFYNNRKSNCYKHKGGVEDLRVDIHVPKDDALSESDDASLDLSKTDTLSESDDMTWPEFVELFQNISQDADSMQDDLLRNLDERAQLMSPSSEKDALLKTIAHYTTKLTDFFEVLDDIEADIDMLSDMISEGIVDVRQVEACIKNEQSEDDANPGNWDAYVDLTESLRSTVLSSAHRTRLIADTIASQGHLLPIGLMPSLNGHYRRFLKWEVAIDAVNSVLEEDQHYAERDSKYSQVHQSAMFTGSKDRYEASLRFGDANITRQLTELRTNIEALEQAHAHTTKTLRLLQAQSSPDYEAVKTHAVAIMANINEQKSRYNGLHASLSNVSLLDHLNFADASCLQDITSDFKSRVPKPSTSEGFEPFAQSTSIKKPKPSKVNHSLVAKPSKVSPLVSKSIRLPTSKPNQALKVRSDENECECGKLTKQQCLATHGCKWGTGVGCSRDKKVVVHQALATSP